MLASSGSASSVKSHPGAEGGRGQEAETRDNWRGGVLRGLHRRSLTGTIVHAFERKRLGDRTSPL